MLEINPTALFIMVKVYNLTTPWIRQWMVKENWNRIFNFDYGIERERGGRRERESWNRISNFDFDIEREREREREESWNRISNFDFGKYIYGLNFIKMWCKT